MQGMRQWGGGRCMPLAFAVLCIGPSQTASSGSHGGIKGGFSSKELGERADTGCRQVMPN